MKRYGQVIRLKPDFEDEYIRLHKEVWPEIKQLIDDCNLHNYSIFLRDGYLFAYFEYDGNDFEKDMRKISSNEINQKWWSKCKPCQEPLASNNEGEWWSEMIEVFHQD